MTFCDQRKSLPQSPYEADLRLSALLLQSSTRVSIVGNIRSELKTVANEIGDFVSRHYRSGWVLIKTSNAGMRSVDHEICQDLLITAIESAVLAVGQRAVIVGDGPAYGTYEEECHRLGWSELFPYLGVRPVDLNNDEFCTSSLGFPVSCSFAEADLIINLVKAKTHRRFGVSLGAKNLIGTLVGSQTGQPKLEGRHRVVPRLVWHLADISPPALTIVDGVRGIEGNGPMKGIPSNSNFFVVSDDYFAADCQTTVEMGFDPILIPYFHAPDTPVNESDFVPVDWVAFRRTNTNFLPAPSCSWLFRSLMDTRNREFIFSNMLEELKLCWS